MAHGSVHGSVYGLNMKDQKSEFVNKAQMWMCSRVTYVRDHCWSQLALWFFCSENHSSWFLTLLPRNQQRLPWPFFHLTWVLKKVKDQRLPSAVTIDNDAEGAMSGKEMTFILRWINSTTAGVTWRVTPSPTSPMRTSTVQWRGGGAGQAQSGEHPPDQQKHHQEVRGEVRLLGRGQWCCVTKDRESFLVS